MDTTKQIFGIILALALIVVAAAIVVPGLASPSPAPVTSPAPSGGTVTVYFFYGEECPHCHTVRPVVESLREKYPDVDFRFLEVYHNQENFKVFAAKVHESGSTSSGVPQVIVGDTVLVGGLEIPNGLEQAILDQKKK